MTRENVKIILNDEHEDGLVREIDLRVIGDIENDAITYYFTIRLL